MKRLLLSGMIGIILNIAAQAGIVKVVTYPVRHPIKLIKKTAHVTKLVIW